MESLKTIISSAPTTTGVYFFKKNKAYLYIGKSVNIRARLRSHVENAKIDAKSAGYVKSATKIEWIVTDSEFKALILESALIQKHKPRYNIRWKDDKSRLYIKITHKDLYPKVSITRREDDLKELYIGPFSYTKTVEKIVREVRKVFPFCMQKSIGKRACFYSKIKLCNPCPSNIEKIQNSTAKKQAQIVYKRNIQNVIRVFQGKSDAVINKLYADLECVKKKEAYEEGIDLRTKIFRLERLLSKRNFNVDDISQYNKSDIRIQSLKFLLQQHLENPPSTLERIECYDMSTLNFMHSTASMVVFENGLSEKKEYKRFKIKDLSAQSDFEMFCEVLTRRFRNTWTHPQLIVVDGGKPQVRTCQRVLAEINIAIPIIGIAKRPDRIILGKKQLLTIRPPQTHDGLQLLQEIRDESHRFAKKYHLLVRRKQMMI